MGENCAINPSVIFTDPQITAIGSNVRMAGGLVMGHDGSVNMLNRAYKLKLDAVGPVILNDNVFVGVGCILLPGAQIGENTIIGAGSVVAGRIKSNGVYAGNPLRYIRSMEEHLVILKKRNTEYPWRDIIETRQGDYDPVLEQKLRKMRITHFFD